MACSEPQSDRGLISSAKAYVAHRFQSRAVPRELVVAWERFYSECDTLIRRYALNCGVRVAELDDTAQQCWLAVIDALPSFVCDAPQGGFHTWLFVLVRNTVVDEARRATPRRREFAAGDDFDHIPGDEPEPGTIFEHRWNERVLHASLVQLRTFVGEEDYLLFEMHQLRAARIADVSADSGLSPPVVRQRLHRTMKHFRTLLVDLGYRDLLFEPRD